MELIGHILLAMLIALIVFTTFSAGIVLIFWFIALGVAISVLVLLRGVFQRWWFLYVSRDPRLKKHKKRPPQIIEAEWHDISDEK